ncbi:MAG: hypothetical protein QOJ99_1732 [Bryobacterales bacterium]|nr:hypothetical protein [Bryobacterales bacterium]
MTGGVCLHKRHAEPNNTGDGGALKSEKNQPYQFEFESADGLLISCARWDSSRPIRGIVQIAHGLGEHIGRYAA